MGLRVFIADDERLICRLLEYSISWDELGLTLSGTFYDGESLYHAVLKEEPDIVITDISMPLINGIEMIRLVREAGCKCQFIIISGYKEFEYAHSALKYNVEDYLLKPINAGELNQALKKLAAKAGNTGSAAGQNAGARFLIESDTGYNRYVLYSLLHNKEAASLTFSEVQERYHTPLKPGLFQCLSVKLTNQAGSENGIPSISAKIIRIIKDQLEPCCDVCLIDCRDSWIDVMMNYQPAARQNLYHNIDKAYTYGENIADIFLGVTISIGIGNAYPGLADIGLSHEESRLAITACLCLGNTQPWFWEQVQEKNQRWPAIDLSVLNILKQDIDTLSPESFEQHFDQMTAFPDQTVNVQSLVRFSHKLIDMLSDAKEELLTSSGQHVPMKKAFELRIQHCAALAEYLTVLKDFVLSEMKHLRTTTMDKYAHPVNQAIQYIEQHYQEAFGLDDIARELGLNPVYLSSLFKKETAINFLEYLHNYRLQKAKSLLKETAMNISEVGIATGYQDSRHFSKQFKKKYGISPSDYKQMYR